MVGGNDVTLLHDGEQVFPAMLQAIAAAREEILLEMYWFHSDRIGTIFAEALCEKAREGVRVQIIYDAVGSWEARLGMFDEMRAAGVEVYQFNPIAPWRKRFNVGVVNRRDHRKLLIVDGRVFFTGGINIGDAWAPVADGGQGWRDDMVRVDGPAALQARALFLETWLTLGKQVLTGDDWRPSDHGVPGGDSRVRVIANFFRGHHAAIRREYLQQIQLATKHVHISNSYFVPDREVRNALAAAVARGATVKVLLPGESDLVAVQYASRRLYAWLMKRGIELWEWQDTILHTKSACIDDRWSTVGTYNLDYRSWRFNLEVNVAVEDENVARAMRVRFDQDLGRSLRIDERDWGFRSLSERTAESFFYLFRRLL
jgi:cardiolipin synthase